MKINPITPCLWFDSEAEDAANFYVSIFKNSEIKSISRFGKAGYEYHKKEEGTVMTVAFTINGQPFVALMADRCTNLPRPFRFRYFAIHKKKLIITGTALPPMVD